MSELEVLKKHQRLFHADVAVYLEAHVGHRITGIEESNDVLGDHIQSRFLEQEDCIQDCQKIPKLQRMNSSVKRLRIR